MGKSSIKIAELGAENWKDFSRHAHVICFLEERKPEEDRIDYALLAVESDVPLGFVTVRDLDKYTSYWQHGGTFPGTRGSTKVLRVMQAFIEEAKSRGYERIGFRVLNTNRAMLKLAFHLNFLVIGVRMFGGEIYLEHMLSLKGV